MGMGSLQRSSTRRNFSSGARVNILGLEVVQSVQNIAHDTPLIARKRTIVRLYLSPVHQHRSIRIRGEIKVRALSGGPSAFVSSINDPVLRRDENPDLHAQRRDSELSMNFLLPEHWTQGDIEIKPHRIFPIRGDDVPLIGAETACTRVAFTIAPVLRVRAIGLRYMDPDSQTYWSPDSHHFDSLRSHLARAFPTPAVEWSQIVVNAAKGLEPPFSDGTLDDSLWGKIMVPTAHAQLMAIRARDIAAGRDPRTHYYGLISDARGFFRGAASRIPDSADPSVVAVGPAGVSSVGFAPWGEERSYADWCGAHEIGHLLGQRHPGCKHQDRDPACDYPYADGRLSDRTVDAVGFDVGDPDLGIPMRAYPNEMSHDIMSYRENQWLSPFTYARILQRLHDTDRQFAPRPAADEEYQERTEWRSFATAG